MRAMLYANRISSAERVAKLANAQSLYAGFAAVANNDSNARQKLAAVDKSFRKDSLYLFAQIQYLRRSGQCDDAAKLMLKAPKDALTLVDPDAWWIERRVLSREMLDENKPKIAYQLVAAHSAESPTLAADAEFHAGWYALRFLGIIKRQCNTFPALCKSRHDRFQLRAGFIGWAERPKHREIVATLFNIFAVPPIMALPFTGSLPQPGLVNRGSKFPIRSRQQAIVSALNHANRSCFNA